MTKKMFFFAFIAAFHAVSLPMGLLEHHNIAFQKKFEKECTKLFAQELTHNPIDLANRFSNAFYNRPYLIEDKPFFLGLSTSAYQIEGGIGEECSYQRFAQRSRAA